MTARSRTSHPDTIHFIEYSIVDIGTVVKGTIANNTIFDDMLTADNYRENLLFEDLHLVATYQLHAPAPKKPDR